MDNLPDDVMTDILVRLPAKCLYRCMCVSLNWYNKIRNPNFVSSFIARNSPSFYIVEPEILVSRPRSVVVGRFELVPEPNVSQFYVNHPLLLSPEKIIRLDDEPDPSDLVLQYHGGLVLFSLEACRYKYGINKRARAENPPHIYALNRLDYEREDVLFVCNGVTPEWVRMKPLPHRLYDYQSVGFVTRVEEGGHPGVVSKYVIAQYRFELRGGWQTMMCLSSDTANWVVKMVSFGFGRGEFPSCKPHSVFAYNERLFWVMIKFGLIVWDEDPFSVSENDSPAECRFIRFPPRHPDGSYHYADEGSAVGVSGGFIQYLQQLVHIDEPSMRLWRLSDTESGNWVLLHEVWSDRLLNLIYLRLHLDNPRACFLHPSDVDVVFFQDGDHLYSFNFRSKLAERVEGDVDRISIFSGIETCLPIMLPPWPPSIPPRLRAVYAKEEGDLFFKCGEFNEAIDSYTESIDLSPSAIAYAKRAKAYLKLKQFQDAEDDCTVALSLDDNCVEAYEQRAIARKELGKEQ